MLKEKLPLIADAGGYVVKTKEEDIVDKANEIETSNKQKNVIKVLGVTVGLLLIGVTYLMIKK